ncbi:acyl-CoA carboxylase subunit beta [Corynebacterium bovis]|uniref:Methylmalonyl-CoA carboxyltransferase n=1 Tax=Corynebacterium bovis TaxID=36808 RepID=A0A3R8RE22_9CORY|nr:acyl-CoA carboxylase subunit beta [Corynebacterium bovis]MDN8578977.1 acyl-CoA carboxylase subunit beta [Corynebacterium bovis]RRO85343.1 methylmalonyl-CoA carboxyltransferase [Corynebacterium bovis]RRO86706.1 methylmalonyl-CoA carboxyltransferase [Corynebacterium bovis]
MTGTPENPQFGGDHPGPLTTAEKLADLHRRLAAAEDPGSERAKAKRDAAGISTPRQRIDQLVDPGSFREIGALGRTPGDPDAPYGDGVVAGYATIDGRTVAVYSHDKSVYGGSVGATFGKKVVEVVNMAGKVGCPVIGINDSGGARIQDAVTSLAWYAEIARRQLPLSGLTPQISVLLGNCAGGAVYAPATTDFIIAVEEQTTMFVTGPAVIESVTGEKVSMQDLGGARVQAQNGNIQHVASSEEDAFRYVRDLLDHLPSTAFEDTPEFYAPDDAPQPRDGELAAIVPDDPNAGYDIMDVLTRIFDDENILELQEEYGQNIITAFARVDGHSVGVVANQPMMLAGCLDAEAADKAARFIRICDAYGIPIIYVVDTPGYLPGVEQEKLGLIHRGAKLGFVLAESTVPKISLVVRKGFGGGWAVMGSKSLGADLSFAWPTAQIAVMGAEAAVVMMKGRELAAMPPEKRPVAKKMFMDFYNANMTSPYVAAERGYIDAMIQPQDTRVTLRRALRQLRSKDVPEVRKKHTILPM